MQYFFSDFCHSARFSLVIFEHFFKMAALRDKFRNSEMPKKTVMCIIFNDISSEACGAVCELNWHGVRGTDVFGELKNRVSSTI